MKQRLNNARTLQRRHFLTGAAGTLLVPLGASRKRRQVRCARARRRPSARFIRATQLSVRLETDADLLRVEGDRVLSKGVPIYLTGRVLDRRGQPLTNAAVEIWQCDANAVYHHPAGGAEAERDPNFQGYGCGTHRCCGRVPLPHDQADRISGANVAHSRARSVAWCFSVRNSVVSGGRSQTTGRDFLFSRMSAEDQAALTLKFEPTTAAVSHALARATQMVARADLVIG